MSVEQTLRAASAATQEWLDEGDAWGVVPGEESLTDRLLLDLAKSNGRQCRVIRLGKYDESRVGADFVLWLVSRRGAKNVGIQLLVQAKRLYPNGRFEALHRVDNDHPQMSVLMSMAKRWGIPPVYALYQPSSKSLGLPGRLPSRCGTIHCGHAGAQCRVCFLVRCELDLGIALAPARAVSTVVERVGSQPSYSELSPRATPFACLAECPCTDIKSTLTSRQTGSASSSGPDLVDQAMSWLTHFADVQMFDLREFPEWLLDAESAQTSNSERRTIARGDVTDDISTVVVISDTDLFEQRPAQ